MSSRSVNDSLLQRYSACKQVIADLDFMSPSLKVYLVYSLGVWSKGVNVLALLLIKKKKTCLHEISLNSLLYMSYLWDLYVSIVIEISNKLM